jgi:hypothetical protein
MSSLPVTTPPITFDVDGYARIQNGGLAINEAPGYYNLDVNGDMRVSDGYGVLTFTHDASSNSVTTISNTPSFASCNATLQVTGGFFSSSGATAGSTATLPLKKGMFMLSAISNSVLHGYVGISFSPYVQIVISSNSTGGTLITSNATDVTIATNTTWTITYFPSA